MNICMGSLVRIIYYRLCFQKILLFYIFCVLLRIKWQFKKKTVDVWGAHIETSFFCSKRNWRYTYIMEHERDLITFQTNKREQQQQQHQKKI